MKPTERFTARADAYRAARPGYPADTVDFLLSQAALGMPSELADVGSGTGKLTGQLLAEHPDLRRVYAVEPNVDMRKAAEAEYGSDPRFASVAGSGEATGLETSSVDAVTVAQAFHWFDFELARAEFQRILRPGARLAVLWNLRLEGADAFHRDYERYLREWGNGYEAVRATWQVRHRLRPLFASSPQVHRSEVVQRLTRSGLEARLQSSSYAPTRLEALDALRSLFAHHAHDGSVDMRYETVTYAGVIAID